MDIYKLLLSLFVMLSIPSFSSGNHLQRRQSVADLTRRRALNVLNARRIRQRNNQRSSVSSTRRNVSSLSQLSQNARRQLLEILAKRRRNQQLIARQRARANKERKEIQTRQLLRNLQAKNIALQRTLAASRNRHLQHSRQHLNLRSTHVNGNTRRASDIGTASVFSNSEPPLHEHVTIHTPVTVDPFHSFVPLANPAINVPQLAFLPQHILVPHEPVNIMPTAAPTNSPIRQKSNMDKMFEMFLMEELGLDPPDAPDPPQKIVMKKKVPESRPSRNNVRQTTVVVQPIISRSSIKPQLIATTPIPKPKPRFIPTNVPKSTSALTELARIAMVQTESPIRIILTTNQKEKIPTTPKPTPPPRKNFLLNNNNNHVLITPTGNFTIKLGNGTSVGHSDGFKIIK